MSIGRAWGAVVKSDVDARGLDLEQDVVGLEVEGGELNDAGGDCNFLQRLTDVWFWIKVNGFCELHGGISN